MAKGLVQQDGREACCASELVAPARRLEPSLRRRPLSRPLLVHDIPPGWTRAGQRVVARAALLTPIEGVALESAGPLTRESRAHCSETDRQQQARFCAKPPVPSFRLVIKRTGAGFFAYPSHLVRFHQIRLAMSSPVPISFTQLSPLEKPSTLVPFPDDSKIISSDGRKLSYTVRRHPLLFLLLPLPS